MSTMNSAYRCDTPTRRTRTLTRGDSRHEHGCYRMSTSCFRQDFSRDGRYRRKHQFLLTYRSWATTLTHQGQKDRINTWKVIRRKILQWHTHPTPSHSNRYQYMREDNHEWREALGSSPGFDLTSVNIRSQEDWWTCDGGWWTHQ